MILYMEGNERYLKKQEVKKAVSLLDNPDFCYREFWSWEDGILEFIGTPSFFGDKKICVLNFFPENEDFLDADVWEGTDIYIITETIPDRRKTVVTQLLKKMETRKYEKIQENVLYKCIFKRLQGHGFKPEEIRSVSEQLQQAFYPYLLDYRINLDTVITHVDMIGYAGVLSDASIQAFALQSDSLKGYLLAAKILDQKQESVDFAQKLLDQGEAPIGLLSLVLFQVRVCYKACLCKQERGNYLSQIGIRNYQIYNRFQRYGAEVYAALYTELQGAVNRIKTGEKNSSAVVLETILRCLQIEKER